MGQEKVIRAVFYRTAAAGTEPVREWLKSLTSQDRKFIGQDIKVVEWKWPQGLPLVRKMDPNLWEIRTDLRGRKSRVLFTVYGPFLVLLHGFVKKDQKTPREDLDIARRRRDQVQKGGLNHG